jgi:hypothetical protein
MAKGYETFEKCSILVKVKPPAGSGPTARRGRPKFQPQEYIEYFED